MQPNKLFRKKVVLPAALVVIVVLSAITALAFVLQNQMTARDESSLVIIQNYPYALSVDVSASLETGVSGQSFLNATVTFAAGEAPSDPSLLIMINSTGIQAADLGSIYGTQKLFTDLALPWTGIVDQYTDALIIKAHAVSAERLSVSDPTRTWFVKIDLDFFLAAGNDWLITVWCQNEA